MISSLAQEHDDIERTRFQFILQKAMYRHETTVVVS